MFQAFLRQRTFATSDSGKQRELFKLETPQPLAPQNVRPICGTTFAGVTVPQSPGLKSFIPSSEAEDASARSGARLLSTPGKNPMPDPHPEL